jgi:hypothetical protein
MGGGFGIATMVVVPSMHGTVFAHAVWVRMVCGVGLGIAAMLERGIAIRRTDCPTCWHGWFIGTIGMGKASLLVPHSYLD